MYEKRAVTRIGGGSPEQKTADGRWDQALLRWRAFSMLEINIKDRYLQ